MDEVLQEICEEMEELCALILEESREGQLCFRPDEHGDMQPIPFAEELWIRLGDLTEKIEPFVD